MSVSVLLVDVNAFHITNVGDFALGSRKNVKEIYIFIIRIKNQMLAVAIFLGASSGSMAESYRIWPFRPKNLTLFSLLKRKKLGEGQVE